MHEYPTHYYLSIELILYLLIDPVYLQSMSIDAVLFFKMIVNAHAPEHIGKNTHSSSRILTTVGKSLGKGSFL